MASSNAAQKAAANDVKELSDQIGQLKEDIADLTQSLSNLGTHSRDAVQSGVKGSVTHLRKKGEKGVQDARRSAEELGDQAAAAVREQPAAAVGLAVGVGFLLGFLTGRK